MGFGGQLATQRSMSDTATKPRGGGLESQRCKALGRWHHCWGGREQRSLAPVGSQKEIYLTGVPVENSQGQAKAVTVPIAARQPKLGTPEVMGWRVEVVLSCLPWEGSVD